jgi:HTH-type transcriptional regulator, competence development regulator
MTLTNNSPKPVNRWLAKMADMEDSCRSVSVGGMAAELLGAEGEVAPRDSQRVFGKLIEYARRAKGWSVEQLAKRADIGIGEIIDIERHDYAIPQPRTVYQLANVLGLPSRRLVEVAGLAPPRHAVNAAALHFAAKSESTAKLTHSEREAFVEFVKALMEIPDGAQELADHVS